MEAEYEKLQGSHEIVMGCVLSVAFLLGGGDCRGRGARDCVGVPFAS